MRQTGREAKIDWTLRGWEEKMEVYPCARRCVCVQHLRHYCSCNPSAASNRQAWHLAHERTNSCVPGQQDH